MRSPPWGKRAYRSGPHGFTLIELMVVVAVIGISAAVTVPKFSEMIRNSREASTKGNLGTLRSALTIYKSDNDGLKPLQYATNAVDVVYFEGHDWLSGYLKDAIFPKYMKAVPTVKGLITHDDVNRLYVGILPEDFDGNKSSAVIVLEWTGGF